MARQLLHPGVLQEASPLSKGWPMPDEVLAAREVATLLKTTPNTVCSWCRSGRLPGFKIGQQWASRRSELQRTMRSQMELKKE